MTPSADPNVYDEDSVFRKIFAEEKKPRPPTKAERMARIFGDAPTSEPVIKVSDFLPRF